MTRLSLEQRERIIQFVLRDASSRKGKAKVNVNLLVIKRHPRFARHDPETIKGVCNDYLRMNNLVHFPPVPTAPATGILAVPTTTDQIPPATGDEENGSSSCFNAAENTSGFDAEMTEGGLQLLPTAVQGCEEVAVPMDIAPGSLDDGDDGEDNGVSYDYTADDDHEVDAESIDDIPVVQSFSSTVQADDEDALIDTIPGDSNGAINEGPTSGPTVVTLLPSKRGDQPRLPARVAQLNPPVSTPSWQWESPVGSKLPVLETSEDEEVLKAALEAVPCLPSDEEPAPSVDDNLNTYVKLIDKSIRNATDATAYAERVRDPKAARIARGVREAAWMAMMLVGIVLQTFYVRGIGHKKMEKILGDKIEGCTTRIWALCYVFSNPVLARRLVCAKQRGVDVKVVLDPTMLAHGAESIRILRSGGVEVHVATCSFSVHFHFKLMLLDDSIPSGSANFSEKALKTNHEVIWIASGLHMVRKAKREFIAVWNDGSEPFMKNYVLQAVAVENTVYLSVKT